MNLDLILHAANKIGTVGAGGNHTRQGLAMLGDDNPFRVQVLQQRKTLLLEFGRIDGLHATIL